MNEPPVIRWFKVYVVVLALLYLLVVGAGVVICVIGYGETSEADALFAGIMLILVGMPLFAGFVLGLFLKPKPWVWIYDLVLISVGFTSCLTLPFSIALLIHFLKPETKAYFGRS